MKDSWQERCEHTTNTNILNKVVINIQHKTQEETFESVESADATPTHTSEGERAQADKTVGE